MLDGLAVDPASDRAVFRQIADQLRAAIQTGRLNEGDRLPSESLLMSHYGVARMTARNALQLLEIEGLTRAEHGRGVFVRKKPPVRRLASDRFARRHRKEGKAAFLAESEQVGAQPDVDLIQVNEMPAPPDIAERLNRTGPVIVRSRRYSLNGVPVETATSYIPADIASGTPIADPNPGPGGIYARLEDLGHTLERFSEEVAARMPTEAEVRLLAMMPGVPVFRLVRTAYDVEGRGVFSKAGTRTSHHFWSSADTPSHTFGKGHGARCARASRNDGCDSSALIRPWRLVRSWNVCQCAQAITANTSAMKASGTDSWNKSDMLFTKIRFGRFQRSGWSTRSGRNVTSKPFSKWWPGIPRQRSANVSA
jgi:GntR family transcriptional regulator